MAYTFGDQLNFLSTLLADSNVDTSSMWPTAQRKTEINHAEKQFARDTKILLENATGTVASKEISVPSGWLETFALYVTISTNKYRIDGRREISPKDLERWSDYAGDIPYYYFWGFSGTKKIKFVGSSAVNGATYDLYYFEQPTTALDDTSDVSLIPEEYRQAPVYKAAANLLLQIGQYTRAQVLQQQYDRLVAQAKSEVETQYKNHNLPSPDLNIIESDPVDTQGNGVWF